jgi:hypothetical protein
LTVRIETRRRRGGEAASHPERETPVPARHQIGANAIFREPAKFRFWNGARKLNLAGAFDRPVGPALADLDLNSFNKHVGRSAQT